MATLARTTRPVLPRRQRLKALLVRLDARVMAAWPGGPALVRRYLGVWKAYRRELLDV